ncbi:Methionine--tRNA ligase [Phycisphaerales bacterium]|nr:Methionine--tRNA ligase [Phycisphaerales bacterium]
MTQAPTPAPGPAAPPSQPEAKPTIAFDEFAKVDLRVARVLSCEPHPSADRLWKLHVDDGSGSPRQICAGIRQFYAPEQLVGQRIIIVANLQPRKIRGEDSNGMLLAASDAPKGAPEGERRVVVLTTLSDMPPGSIVS